MACGDSALEAGNRRRSTSSDADAERFHVDMDLGPVVIEAFTSIFPLLYALYYADRKLKATKAHLGGVGPLGSWSGTPSLREVRAEGWSELSPRCVGAAARRAGLSPLFCDAPISRRPVCFLMHTLPPFGPAELGGFFLEFLRTDSEFGASRPLRERIRGHRGSISLRSFFSRH